MSLLYDTGNAYDSQYTYYGVGDGVYPVLKIEMDLSSSFPTEVLDIDYGGVLAYDTKTVYDDEDRYDGFVLFDDITTAVRSVEITRGKSSLTYEHFDAGTCALNIGDFNSTFLPDEPNSPYYPNIKPLRQVRVSATWSGETFILFRGFVDNWGVRWEPRQDFAEVTVQSTDATKLLANFDTEYQGLDGDTAWERVRDMLLDKSWPTDFTDVQETDYFAFLVQDTADRRPLLPNLQEYEFTEQGALFISKEGRVTWKNIATANPYYYDSPEFVFSDASTVGKVPTTEILYSVSDEQVYNFVSITPTLGTEQTYSSNDSIDIYRERSLIKTDVPLNSDSSASYLATLLISKQALPESRITGVSTDPRLSIHATNASLRSEMLTMIDLDRTPPGGTATTYKMFIIGIRHTITPDSWLTEFSTDHRRENYIGPVVIT